jgi:hypothetical protein
VFIRGIRALVLFPDQRLSARISGDVLREAHLHIGALGQVNAFHKADFAAVARHDNG